MSVQNARHKSFLQAMKRNFLEIIEAIQKGDSFYKIQIEFFDDQNLSTTLFLKYFMSTAIGYFYRETRKQNASKYIYEYYNFSDCKDQVELYNKVDQVWRDNKRIFRGKISFINYVRDINPGMFDKSKVQATMSRKKEKFEELINELHYLLMLSREND